MYIFCTLPSHQIKAFEAVFGAAADDEKLEAFASRWGGLDFETFRRVLEIGQGKDKLVAIFAIGYMATPEAQTLLLPLLHSVVQQDRWASAICLGEMEDERAFPYLQAMLLEGLSLDPGTWPRSNEEHWEEHWYDECRIEAVSLLAACTEPSLIPTMRQAFIIIWKLVQAGHPHLFGYSYQDELTYALGQRGAFGVLTGLDLPPPHRKTAMVYLALGYLQAKTRYRRIISELMLNETLQQEVAEVLAQRFGLSEEEREDCVANYYDNSGARKRYGQPTDATGSEEQDEDDEDDDEEEEQDEEASRSVVPLPLCIYQGHASAVNSLAWSPDGTRLVSASQDGTAQVWDANTGERLLTFGEHTASVNVVAWSPHGDLIASGGSDNLVYVWDAVSGEQICAYAGHSAWICRALAWSPDGTRIASGSWDHTVQVWEVFSGKCLLTYRGHEGVVYAVAWSPDGSRIASGGGYPECLVHLWNAATGQAELIYRGHTAEELNQHPEVLRTGELWYRGASSVHSLAWSADGTRLASAGLRGVLRIWDATSGGDLGLSLDRTHGSVVWSPDGTYVLTGTHEGCDVLCATGELVAHYTPQGLHDVEAVAWSPDGTRVAAAGRNRVYVWER
jgi:hypothetical protein